MSRFAVIPTRNRPAELESLIAELKRDNVYVVVIDNGSSPPVARPVNGEVIVHDEQPPNLSRLWNIGLARVDEIARSRELETWHVGIFNDDTVIGPVWWNYVASELRETGAAAASSDAYGTLTTPIFRREPTNVLTERMCPWAFIIRGELGLRADERFAWWYGDTDLEWTACASGGVLVLPGVSTINRYANSTTVGELAEQAGRDREAFAAKWGRVPW